MSRDASGNMTLTAGNPVVTLTTITSAWANGTMTDFQAEITNSLDRNGRGAMLAQFKAFDGTALLPGISWGSELASGFYRISTQTFGAIVNAARVGGFDASGFNQSDLNATPTFYRVGFRDVPQNAQSVAYGLVLSDAGKHIYHPSADTTARIWTVPANAAQAFPIGTAMTIVNDNAAGVLTIAITTDTLVWAPSGTTGSRTLAANGCATLLKMTATRWQITGVGLT